MILKSLPGYGNGRLKKKDMEPVNCDGESNKTSIKVID